MVKNFKRFYFIKLTKNFSIELDFLKNFASLNWFPILNHNFDVKLKGSHKGIYWSFFLIGFKIFEINIYDNRHDEIKYDPIIDY
jgi:hypothetical protein